MQNVPSMMRIASGDCRMRAQYHLLLVTYISQTKMHAKETFSVPFLQAQFKLKVRRWMMYHLQLFPGGRASTSMRIQSACQ